MHTSCLRRPERALDFRELELQMVVCCHGGAQNLTQPSARAAGVLSHCARLQLSEMTSLSSLALLTFCSQFSVPCLSFFLFTGFSLSLFLPLFVCYFYFYSNERTTSWLRMSCGAHRRTATEKTELVVLAAVSGYQAPRAIHLIGICGV